MAKGTYEARSAPMRLKLASLSSASASSACEGSWWQMKPRRSATYAAETSTRPSHPRWSLALAAASWASPLLSPSPTPHGLCRAAALAALARSLPQRAREAHAIERAWAPRLLRARGRAATVVAQTEPTREAQQL